MAAQLPSGRYVVNCVRIVTAFCWRSMRVHYVARFLFLPSSRAPGVVAEIYAAYPDSYCLGDRELSLEALRYWHSPEIFPELDGAIPSLSEDAVVAIGFTSGSTGAPYIQSQNLIGFGDQWSKLRLHFMVVWKLSGSNGRRHSACVWYEFSVLLPLLAPVAVHAGRPFFP